MKTESNEFYIGWQDAAPAGISKRVRQFVLTVLVVVAAVSALLVLHQSGFATSAFEYGEPSELEGVLVKTPAPFLQVFRGNDVNGQPVFQNILLVAPGKHGATEMLLALEDQLGHPLDGRMVKMKGYLIYHDGKTLMEVEEMADVREEGAASVEPPQALQLGNGAFLGEITDPKCLFGVMKPGYGKPHRSCAARCIAGGIPPVLKTISTDGKTQYFLMAGENGEPVNGEILPYVGDQVQVCGEVYRMGNWLVLYKNKSKPVTRLAGNEAVRTPVCQ
jgi:hypothetical protein